MESEVEERRYKPLLPNNGWKRIAPRSTNSLQQILNARVNVNKDTTEQWSRQILCSIEELNLRISAQIMSKRKSEGRLRK